MLGISETRADVMSLLCFCAWNSNIKHVYSLACPN